MPDIGSRVIVRGLQKAAQYNGKEGVIICKFKDIGRLGVRLTDGKELKVAPENLDVVDSSSATARQRDAAQPSRAESGTAIIINASAVRSHVHPHVHPHIHT